MSSTMEHALRLIASQDKRKSNSPDPGHEHYLRLVLISIAERALAAGATASTTSASGNEQVAAEVEGEGSREELPQDVIDLVVAAREYVYTSHHPDDDGYKAVDAALEVFASRVPWDLEADPDPPSTVRGE
jgi:hypothetical protein